MKAKTIHKAIAGLALATGVVGSAQAFPYGTFSGPVTFQLQGVDMGALYSASCVDEADCNSKQTNAPLAGAVAGEDSYGLFQVTTILGGPSGTTILWQAGDFSEYIIGKFGGLVDFKSTVTGSSPFLLQQSWSKNGSIDMYLTNNSSLFTQAVQTGPSAAARALITGSSFLSGNMVNGAVDPLEPNASAFSIFMAQTRTLASNGYVDVVSGSFFNNIVPNTVPDNTGGYQDAAYSFTWDTTSTSSQYGWTVPFDGPVGTSVLPEPGSMALVGLGLLGLGGLRRRKAA